ncbi:hypothetical protein J32TS6_41670 [Virgibacillus pantothenticus]|uniref:Uncharacterized protein n=1 Tax=Virgibacillus pantothenticus TaxID=1473 RepID=A0A0L0QWQ8_VIRPA|nr:hypothetical protein [Virgibacillus pantothenticus]KNE22638.1 hypothetical protein AFK71_00315 [Virgibacillus pantothenticus]MBU8567007.1 hypothetical protein [Virgibacillus pantothenticus]MBU8601931.1 hypothetical protein [Virgibacillus pantothenticus]MBU8635034.1 hypothetical protein [Virgibacillus pantothenticus]MBU8642863.1 hypothetical protein [Virgibacillus pantothenticus]
MGKNYLRTNTQKGALKKQIKLDLEKKYISLDLEHGYAVWSLSQKHQNILAKSISILLDKQMTPY